MILLLVSLKLWPAGQMSSSYLSFHSRMLFAVLSAFHMLKWILDRAAISYMCAQVSNRNSKWVKLLLLSLHDHIYKSIHTHTFALFLFHACSFPPPFLSRSLLISLILSSLHWLSVACQELVRAPVVRHTLLLLMTSDDTLCWSHSGDESLWCHFERCFFSVAKMC